MPTPTPPTVNVNIKKQGEKTEHLALLWEPLPQLMAEIKNVLASHVSVFPVGHRTNLELREYVNGENGKAASFHFFGLDPVSVKDILNNYLNQSV